MKWNDGSYALATPSEEWSDSEFECPVCGGVMQRNNWILITSMPPKRKYRCRDCGEVRFRYE